MDVREKLIEILQDENNPIWRWLPDNICISTMQLADHLIANSVTVQENTAADVAPVVHGRWIDAREYCGDYMCSNCEALYGTNKFNYCPNCGAKMDGGRE